MERNPATRVVKDEEEGRNEDEENKDEENEENDEEGEKEAGEEVRRSRNWS